MNFKKIGLVLAVSAAATSANAAWNTGTAFDTDGELVLNVWNNVTKTSFTQDLNIATDSVDSIALGSVFSLDSEGLAHVSAGSAAAGDIQWNIVGANNNLSAFGASWNGSTFAARNEFSYYATQTDVPAAGHNDANYSAFWNGIDILNNTINNNLDVTSGGDAYRLTGAAVYAGNDTVFGTTQSGLSNQSWVNKSAAADGESLYAYSFVLDDAFTGIANKSAGFWTLNAASGELSYSAVPVPAAVWMFASGLVGLAGIARRKKA